MTNNQLFVALIGTLLTLLGAFYKVQKDYMDARFTGLKESMDARFDAIDKQLSFLLDHFADHQTRLGKLEERTKKL